MQPNNPNPNDSDNSPPPEVPPFGAPARQSSAPPPLEPSVIYPHTGMPPEPPSKHHGHHQREGWRSIVSTALIFLLAPVLALLVAAFIIQSYQVDGESMETTLQNHDRLLVDKFPRTWARLTSHAYVPDRGDIIVFNQSGLPNVGADQQKQLIKRVIGLPGERVEIKDGVITVYNRAHPNGFNPDELTGYHITATNTPGSGVTNLPTGQIFVCGDNRGNSEDSRYFGPVDINNIVGKLTLRLLPFDKIQKF